MPRRRTLGKLSRPAIESIRASAMLPLPIALGDSTGSAPETVTQMLPATATSPGRHEQPPGPSPAAARLGGADAAADGGEDAREEQAEAADGLPQGQRRSVGSRSTANVAVRARASGTATAKRRR